MAKPGSLVDLALDTLAKYVYMLCVSLKSVTEAEIINRQLSHMIAKFVPITVADKMTNAILQSLDHWIHEDGREKINTVVFELLVKSIIHPAVTRIEPAENIVDIPNICQLHGFYNWCSAIAIIKNIHLFHNLKALNVLSERTSYIVYHTIRFPEQLVEFSGSCTDKTVSKLAKSCKSLKVLNIQGRLSDKSVKSILKMEHLVKLDISRTNISNVGITKFLTEYTKKHGNAYALRFLMVDVLTIEHINMITERLPDVKVIIYEYLYKHAGIECYVSSNFHNLIGLDITTKLIDLNLLLHIVGKQLIYLSVRVEDTLNTHHEFEISDIISIGKLCRRLTLFKISWFSKRCPRLIDTVEDPLPGFHTISNLMVNIEFDMYDNIQDVVKKILKFLLFHCVNVKKVMLPIAWCIFSSHEFVRMSCMKNIEELYLSMWCDLCDIHDQQENDEDYEVQMLIDNCPNLRFVKGVPGLDINGSRNTQRLKFSSIY